MTRRRVLISETATRDVVDTGTYLARHSPDASERFPLAVLSTAQLLAESPGLGRPWDPARSPYRMAPVKGFPVWIIFYEADDRRLVVVRVPHGARDLPRALGL